MGKITDRPQVIDFPLVGGDKLVTEEQALINSMKLWITSYAGDFIGLRTRGGYATNAINRPLDEEETDLVYAGFMEGFKEDFSPQLEITQLNVAPNREKRRWDVEIEAFVPSLNMRVFVRESIKDKKQ